VFNFDCGRLFVLNHGFLCHGFIVLYITGYVLTHY